MLHKKTLMGKSLANLWSFAEFAKVSLCQYFPQYGKSEYTYKNLFVCYREEIWVKLCLSIIAACNSICVVKWLDDTMYIK